jgi:poly(A) polymerase
MQEIWLLQSRFSLRQRKRVVRLLAHPRFRAAYDFLLLRQSASDGHAADIAFWAEAQHDPDHALAVNAVRAEVDAETDEDGGEGRKPRRRRRRRPAATGL